MQDRALVVRYQREPDVRDAVVEAFMFLADTLARRYHRGHEPLEDLRQVAAYGLLKALRRFDPTRGTSFTGYAVPTIAGELRRHFRDKGWAVRVPRDLQELALRVAREEARLECALGRRPTVAEVGLSLARTDEQILEAREAFGALHAASLDTPGATAHGLVPVGDQLGSADRGFERAELAATIERLSRCLTIRHRKVLALRFGAGLTQAGNRARDRRVADACLAPASAGDRPHVGICGPDGDDAGWPNLRSSSRSSSR